MDGNGGDGDVGCGDIDSSYGERVPKRRGPGLPSMWSLPRGCVVGDDTSSWLKSSFYLRDEKINIFFENRPPALYY